MKLVIVSNRLPMSLHEKQGHWEFTESPGGLASGLRAYLRSAEARELDYVWVGWPGTEVAAEFQAEVTTGTHLAAPRFATVCVRSSASTSSILNS